MAPSARSGRFANGLLIEIWHPSRLVPYGKNARTHSSEQVDQIVASINRFGFTNPILVDGKAGIIAGHGRLLAAQKLGLEEVPAVVLEHLTETRAGLTEDDSAPEPVAAAVTTSGDSWVFGQHRLVCGEATQMGVVEKVLAGGLADMTFTDLWNIDAPRSLGDLAGFFLSFRFYPTGTERSLQQSD